MKISVAIFDLDGTLIDSENEWGLAFSNVMKSLGVTPENHHPQIGGMALKENWILLIAKYKIKTTKTPDELAALTYEEYKKLIPQITLQRGALEFIEDLKNAGVLIALATSANWEVTDAILKNLEIENLFNVITTSEEVLQLKPDPEIYFKTLDKLDVQPKDCLVFEDTKSGIEAAHQADIKVVAIDPSGEKTDLDDANLVVEGFSEITPQVIDQL